MRCSGGRPRGEREGLEEREEPKFQKECRGCTNTIDLEPLSAHVNQDKMEREERIRSERTRFRLGRRETVELEVIGKRNINH